MGDIRNGNKQLWEETKRFLINVLGENLVGADNLILG